MTRSAPIVHVGTLEGAPSSDPPPTTGGKTWVTIQATGVIAAGAALLGGIVGWAMRDSQAEAEAKLKKRGSNRSSREQVRRKPS